VDRRACLRFGKLGNFQRSCGEAPSPPRAVLGKVRPRLGFLTLLRHLKSGSKSRSTPIDALRDTGSAGSSGQMAEWEGPLPPVATKEASRQGAQQIGLWPSGSRKKWMGLLPGQWTAKSYPPTYTNRSGPPSNSAQARCRGWHFTKRKTSIGRATPRLVLRGRQFLTPRQQCKCNGAPPLRATFFPRRLPLECGPARSALAMTPSQSHCRVFLE